MRYKRGIEFYIFADWQFTGWHRQTHKRSIAGDDDFSGLRKYAEGDALPRIDWKAYARERGLQVKQFTTLEIVQKARRSIGESSISPLQKWWGVLLCGDLKLCEVFVSYCGRNC